MNQKLIERLQKFANVLFLYKFFSKKIKWLCENFYNEKLKLVYCEYGGKIEEVNEENMKKICRYHKILMKVNDIKKNDFLSKEKKCNEFLNLQFYDKETFINLIELFDFSTKDIKIFQAKKMNFLSVKKQKFLFEYLEQDVG